MSAGREKLVRTARGAILYDGSCLDQPRDAVFERDHWRAAGAIDEVAGGRGTVAFVGRNPRWVLRHYRRGGLVARLLDDRYFWAGEDRTRAFAEWRLLRQLREWGLPVPRPVAARYVRGPFTYRADLLTEELPVRTTLAQALRAGPLHAQQWRDVGALVAALHAHGVHHADLNAHNLLPAEAGRVYVLDFDRGRIRERGAWEREVLERLERSLRKVTADLPAGRFGPAEWRELMEGYDACASSTSC